MFTHAFLNLLAFHKPWRVLLLPIVIPEPVPHRYAFIRKTIYGRGINEIGSKITTRGITNLLFLYSCRALLLFITLEFSMYVYLYLSTYKYLAISQYIYLKIINAACKSFPENDPRECARDMLLHRAFVLSASILLPLHPIVNSIQIYDLVQKLIIALYIRKIMRHLT